MTGGVMSAMGRVLGAELVTLAMDHAAWSQKTFGSDADRGPLGPLRHLEMEAREAQQAAEAVGYVSRCGSTPFHTRNMLGEELADCLLLLLDAGRRAGFDPLAIVREAAKKMERNKARKWETPVDGQPCEHVHDGDHTGGGPVG